MPQLQFREGNGPKSNESAIEGEPFWDATKRRLGVFSQFKNAVIWGWRRLENSLMLDHGETLSGFISSGTPNDLLIDMNENGKILFKNRYSGEVIAEFTSSGCSFNSAEVQGATRSGLSNSLINANFTVPYSLISDEPFVNRDRTKEILAPNWQMWCSSDGVGGLSATFVTADLPKVGGIVKALRIKPDSNPTHAGVRTFIHDAVSFANQDAVISVLVKGPAGQQAAVRIVSPSGVLSYTEYLATGNWQRVDVRLKYPIRSQFNEANFIAIDAVYNPRSANAADYWYLGGVQQTRSSVPVAWDFRPIEMEKSLVHSIYQETKFKLTQGETKQIILTGLLDGNIELNSEGSTFLQYSITDRTYEGFTASAVEYDGDPNVKTIVRAVLCRIPNLPESN